jgi:hypothetical protein
MRVTTLFIGVCAGLLQSALGPRPSNAAKASLLATPRHLFAFFGQTFIHVFAYLSSSFVATTAAERGMLVRPLLCTSQPSTAASDPTSAISALTQPTILLLCLRRRPSPLSTFTIPSPPPALKMHPLSTLLDISCFYPFSSYFHLPHASHYFTFGIVIMNTPLALTRKFTPATPRNPPSPYPSPSITTPAFLFELPISPHQTRCHGGLYFISIFVSVALLFFPSYFGLGSSRFSNLTRPI